MKRIHYIFRMAAAIAVSVSLLSSCEEWDQVFTGDYGKADVYEPVTMQPNISIKDLKALYVKQGEPVDIENDYIIGGQVVSEDRSGNIYKSIYIQDETGGIEIKIGKNALYNDYKLGQWVYVKCNGLTLGEYNGMPQLGYKDPTEEYETSYLEVQYIIDTHIFRGELATPVQAKEVEEANLLDEQNLGCYVSLKGLTYGSVSNPNGEIFCLLYLDQSKDKKNQSNRVFLSGGRNYAPVADPTWGITTWAMSKQKMLEYLDTPVSQGSDKCIWDDAVVADNSGKKVGDAAIKNTLVKNASAYAVSQYFRMGSTNVQIRTSGYARFADYEIDPAIRGVGGTKATINVKGILTKYDGKPQFTLINVEDVEIVK